ncbi:MAG: hypothetical protein ACR2N8_01120 [Parvibaculales bacterium]
MRYILSILVSVLYPIFVIIGFIIGSWIIKLILFFSPDDFANSVVNLPALLISVVIGGAAAAWGCGRIYKKLHIGSVLIVPVVVSLLFLHLIYQAQGINFYFLESILILSGSILLFRYFLANPEKNPFHAMEGK